MSGGISVDVRGLVGLRRQFDILMMPPTQRKKLLRLVAYRLRGDCQRRVKKRIDLEGRPFAKHPGHTNARHSFDTAAKLMAVTNLTDINAEIGWRSVGMSRLAWKINYGSSEYVDDEKKTHDGFRNAEETRPFACSVFQARQLVAYGYRQNGEKARKPATVRWLRGELNADGKRVNFHMSYAKAATILDDMHRRGYQKSRTELGAEEHGKVKIPARSFLGATPQEIANYIDTIFEQMEQELTRHGTR
jgi:hypothetical protein